MAEAKTEIAPAVKWCPSQGCSQQQVLPSMILPWRCWNEGRVKMGEMDGVLHWMWGLKEKGDRESRPWGLHRGGWRGWKGPSCELWALQAGGRGGSGCWRGLEASFNPCPTALQGLPSAGGLSAGWLCHRAAQGRPQRSEAAHSLILLPCPQHPPCKQQSALIFRLTFWALKRQIKRKELAGLLRFTNWRFLPLPVCSLTDRQCFEHQYNWTVKWQEILRWLCPALQRFVDLQCLATRVCCWL